MRLRFANPPLRLFLLLLPALLVSRTAAQGVVLPDASPLRLDEVGLYQVGYQMRGGPEKMFPFGWSGGFDDVIGIACQPAGTQNGESAFLLHPPWRHGTGVTFQTFTIRLLHASKITLRGATALRSDAVGKSDGVTFRVFVDGVKRLDVNRADAQWRSFSVDLTAGAGKTVQVRFETDPGPHDDSSFDFGLWGDREIAFGGWTPTATHHPTPLPLLSLTRLTSRQNGEVVPPSGWSGKISVQVTPAEAVLHYQGPDGTLEYHWTVGDGHTASPFGTLTLHAKMSGDQAVEVPFGGQAALAWTASAMLLHSRLTATPGGAKLTRVYQVGERQATVTITGHLLGKSLVLEVACDQPLVSRLDGGTWGPVQRRRSIGVPYYSNSISYLPAQNLFAGAFLDWTHSNASSQSGTQADYGARTDGTRSLLRERLIYTAAWQLAETLPNIPNPPSPYRQELGHRIVFDVWGGDFATVQSRLQALIDAGVPPGVVLLHDWQHKGYDNGLPGHVPANPALGGDPAMKALVTTAQRMGFRMALHENYVDYYPNYDGFTDTDIAHASDGSRVPAWYNPGTKIQSFAVKPTVIQKLAQQQGAQVKSRYGSNACYLDVHSAVPPWFHVDFGADSAGAGTFRPTWDAHRALWAYERKLHDGPVFGEGNNHWYWSGYLDGVEAQFGQGWHDGDGTDAPLMADFDLLKIHPLQFSHGMGYYERWWSHGPGPDRSLLDLLDQYRMQEITYGHAGFLGAPTWDNVGLAWLESHLLLPVTSRNATAQAAQIAYQVKGRWVDTTAAAKAGDFSRLRVRYDNGLTVWANSTAAPMPVGGVTLPRWGWLAKGAGVTAGTTLRHGVVTDAAATADSLFVNARAARDWSAPGTLRVRPTVATFTRTGPHTFRAVYHWAAGETPRDDLNCFVHFVRNGPDAPNEGIRFQQDHTLSRPTSQWNAGETVSDGPWDITVPADVAPGDYLWTIGLFRTGGGRLTLQGPSDSQSRVILGTLHVTTSAVSFTPASPVKESPEPVNAANTVIDFGDLRTDGSVQIHRDGPDWVLMPFPANRPFTVELSAHRFPMPAHVRALRPGGVIHPISAGDHWRLPLGGAAEYRWPAVKISG